jgi:HPt (histidine-containing phosphotransfer) domain-containing protein
VSTRHCVVPTNLGDDLTHALEVLDEALSHLAGWLEDEDPPTWPPSLADGAAADALVRIAAALRPTQGPDDGPRWFAPHSRYEHAPLRFVDVEQADLDTLAAAAAAMDRALHRTGAPDLAKALESAAAAADVTAVDVVMTLVRLHGLLNLASTRDVEQLHAAAAAAGSRDLILSSAQEDGYQRTVARLSGMWALGDGLEHFLY